MMRQNRQRVLTSVPIVLLLGMGSSWLVLRGADPKSQPLVDTTSFEKGQREVADKDTEKPPRIQRGQGEREKEQVKRGKREQRGRQKPDKGHRGRGNRDDVKRKPKKKPMA